jgi:hypothetical protein
MPPLTNYEYVPCLKYVRFAGIGCLLVCLTACLPAFVPAFALCMHTCRIRHAALVGACAHALRVLHLNAHRLGTHIMSCVPCVVLQPAFDPSGLGPWGREEASRHSSVPSRRNSTNYDSDIARVCSLDSDVMDPRVLAPPPPPPATVAAASSIQDEGARAPSFAPPPTFWSVVAQERGHNAPSLPPRQVSVHVEQAALARERGAAAAVASTQPLCSIVAPMWPGTAQVHAPLPASLDDAHSSGQIGEA